ncbi:hypothetical protein PC128_g13734 [Phytophthora cactorum]|nr:hypothetical protein PC128_g13734 [Phytophthora cactorum]
MTYASDVSGSLLTIVLSSLSQTSSSCAYSMSISVKVFQAAGSGEQKTKTTEVVNPVAWGSV